MKRGAVSSRPYTGVGNLPRDARVREGSKEIF